MSQQINIQGAANGATNIMDLVAALTGGSRVRKESAGNGDSAFAALLKQLEGGTSGEGAKTSVPDVAAVLAMLTRESGGSAVNAQASAEDHRFTAVLASLESSGALESLESRGLASGAQPPLKAALQQLIADLAHAAPTGLQAAETNNAAGDDARGNVIAAGSPGTQDRPRDVPPEAIKEEFARLTNRPDMSGTAMKAVKTDALDPLPSFGTTRNNTPPAAAMSTPEGMSKAAEAMKSAMANLPDDVKARIEALAHGKGGQQPATRNGMPKAGAAGEAGKSDNHSNNQQKTPGTVTGSRGNQAQPAAANRNAEAAIRGSNAQPPAALQSLLQGMNIRVQSDHRKTAGPKGLMTSQTTAAILAAGTADTAKTAGGPLIRNATGAAHAPGQSSAAQLQAGQFPPPGQTPSSQSFPASPGVPAFQFAASTDDMDGAADAILTNGTGAQGHMAAEPLDTSIAKIARAPMTHQAPPQQVAMHITKAVEQGLNRFLIQLEPAELGKVEVDLEVGNHGRVHAAVRADSPETLDLLQRDSRQLMKALEDAGLKPDSGSLDFSLQQETEDGTPTAGGRPKQAAGGAFSSGDDVEVEMNRPHRRHEGALDLWI